MLSRTHSMCTAYAHSHAANPGSAGVLELAQLRPASELRTVPLLACLKIKRLYDLPERDFS